MSGLKNYQVWMPYDDYKFLKKGVRLLRFRFEKEYNSPFSEREVILKVFKEYMKEKNIIVLEENNNNIDPIASIKGSLQDIEYLRKLLKRNDNSAILKLSEYLETAGIDIDKILPGPNYSLKVKELVKEVFFDE